MNFFKNLKKKFFKKNDTDYSSIQQNTEFNSFSKKIAL